MLIPEVDFARCTFCGRCAEVCQYHAIAVVGKQVLVFPELCHGCGSCTLNCPEEAIREVVHVMGTFGARATPGAIAVCPGHPERGRGRWPSRSSAS